MLEIPSSRRKYITSWRKEEPRIGPWGTPALIGNCGKNVASSITTKKLTEKWESKCEKVGRSKYLIGFKFLKTPACQTQSKGFGISSAAAC